MAAAAAGRLSFATWFRNAAIGHLGNTRIAADGLAAAAAVVPAAVIKQAAVTTFSAAPNSPSPMQSVAARVVLLITIPQLVDAGGPVIAGVGRIDIPVVRPSPDVPSRLPVQDRRFRADPLWLGGDVGLLDDGGPEIAPSRGRGRTLRP